MTALWAYSFTSRSGPTPFPNGRLCPSTNELWPHISGTADTLECAVERRLGEMTAVAVSLVDALVADVFDARVAQ